MIFPISSPHPLFLTSLSDISLTPTPSLFPLHRLSLPLSLSPSLISLFSSLLSPSLTSFSPPYPLSLPLLSHHLLLSSHISLLCHLYSLFPLPPLYPLSTLSPLFHLPPLYLLYSVSHLSPLSSLSIRSFLYVYDNSIIGVSYL